LVKRDVVAAESASLLFLYGPSGSGKTRLLQKIAESLSEVQSVMRIGSEEIVYEMARAFEHRNYIDFFDRFSRITNLLIDNLWILKSRPAAAEEMGRLIKARMAQGNLTVLASDLTYEEVRLTLPAVGDCLKHEGAIHLKMVQEPPRHITGIIG
jgi:chromosomal replication initiation ATPase DnaA